jgi:hypothetical protein
MKKFIIGAAAALIATVSLSATAEAGYKWKHKHHHGHHHGHHYKHRIWIGGHHYGDYCFIKKIKRYDDWGNVYIKRVRVCAW